MIDSALRGIESSFRMALSGMETATPPRKRRSGGTYVGQDPFVKVSQAMSEPQARMWQEALRRRGIIAVVKNEDLPPYTAPISPEFSVWVKDSEARRGREIIAQDS